VPSGADSVAFLANSMRLKSEERERERFVIPSVDSNTIGLKAGSRALLGMSESREKFKP